jgi:hypothetical protein
MNKYGNIITGKIGKLIKGVFLLCLVAMPITMMSQSAYKGRMTITDRNFVLSVGVLHIHMRVNISPQAVKGNESLTFTPALKWGDNTYHFSSAIINGEKLERTEHRSDVLLHRVRSDAAALKYDSQGVRYFFYDSSVPYVSWMCKAGLFIDNETCNCNGHHARMYEDRLLANIMIKGVDGATDEETDGSTNVASGINSIPYNDIIKWIQFLPPPTEDFRDIIRTGVIAWNSKDGKDGLENLDEKSQNIYICEKLNEQIKSISEQYTTTFTGMSLTGYGCPAGDYQNNMKTGMKRALSLKKYLMENIPANKNEINVGWVSEDWDSIATIVSQSRMLLCDAVIDIIRSVKVVDGREDAIKKLNNGLPYYYMQTNIFPEVKRIAYTLRFNHRNLSVDAAKQMLKHSPGNMTLKELYSVADSYGLGSREFSDIIDLSACLFPDSPEANINAAAVAMLRGEVKQARKYLVRWQADPSAFENMAVLNLLEGNRTKAEFYLELAQTTGVPQATVVINALNNTTGK